MERIADMSTSLGFLKRRDDPNWDDFFAKYSPALLKHVRKIVGSETDAEDIVEDVFCRLFETVLECDDPFESLSHVRNWLFQVAENLAIDSVRKRKRRAERGESVLEGRRDREHTTHAAGVPDRDQTTPSVLAVFAERLSSIGDELATFVQRLRREQKFLDLAILDALYGMDWSGEKHPDQATYTAVAEFLRAPPGAWQNRLQQAKKLLRSTLRARLTTYAAEETRYQGVPQKRLLDLSTSDSFSQHFWCERHLGCIYRGDLAGYSRSALPPDKMTHMRLHLDLVNCDRCRDLLTRRTSQEPA